MVEKLKKSTGSLLKSFICFIKHHTYLSSKYAIFVHLENNRTAGNRFIFRTFITLIFITSMSYSHTSMPIPLHCSKQLCRSLMLFLLLFLCSQISFYSEPSRLLATNQLKGIELECLAKNVSTENKLGPGSCFGE